MDVVPAREGPLSAESTVERGPGLDSHLESGRLRIAFEVAELGAWDYDLETGIVTACDRVRAMFGSDGPLERLEDWIARLHPADRERVFAAFQRAVAAGSVYEDECRVIRSDGSIIWVAARAAPVVDSRGRTARLTGVAKDITARKQMEEALLASEADARRRLAETEAICECAPVGLCLLDTNLRFVRVNRRFAEMNGWPPEAHAGKTPRELNPGLGDIAEELLRRVLESGKPQLNVEVRGTTAAQPGVQRVWNEHWLPLKGPSGEIVGISIAAEEVTEAKRVEAALRESEERFRTMADGCPAIIWVSDAEGKNRFVNRTYREFFGVTYEEVEGYGWRPLVHPDDEPEYVAALVRGIRERAPFRAEARVRRADGEWRWISSYGEPRFSASGEFLGHAGISPDITERKEAERALTEAVQRLNAHMDNSPLAMIEADAQFRVIRWSNGAERMFGWSTEEVLGRAVLTEMRWVHEDDVESVRRMCQGMLDGTGPRNVHFNRNYRKDGSVAECEWYNSALYDENGRLRSILSQVLDVTDRKRIEERLRQAQKTESIALLAGGVAHDFNNLLVGVMGNASVAREMLPETHPVTEMLDRILKASEQAADLTRQMLAYSGKGRLLSEPLNISELIRESSALVGPSINKKICIRLELDPGLPTVEADRSQIHQILSNLMLNAAEAIGDKAGAISVSTGVRQLTEAYIRGYPELAGLEPGTYVWLTVRDTGCGMAERTRVRIFDPFFTTKFTGRGLGLAAVAGIVRRHKGAIQVESAVGRGSTFTVWLPALEQAALQQRPVERPGGDLRGCGTILVVDDEEPVRGVAQCLLERYGYRVLTADSGQAAIELLGRESRHIRLVILDLTMPVMGGQDTLPALRRIKPDISVIVSSGYPEAETMRLFAGLHVAGYIQKPYTMQQLARKVKTVLA